MGNGYRKQLENYNRVTITILAKSIELYGNTVTGDLIQPFRSSGEQWSKAASGPHSQRRMRRVSHLNGQGSKRNLTLCSGKCKGVCKTTEQEELR